MGHYVDGSGPVSFKCYLASSGAVSTALPIAQFRDAVSTDSPDFYPPKNLVIDDIQSSATGQVRMYSNGSPTYAIIDLGSRGNTNSGRNINLGFPLGQGVAYRFYVESQLSA